MTNWSSKVSREVEECLRPLWIAALPFVCLFAPQAAARACRFAAFKTEHSPAVGFYCAEFFLNRYQTLFGVFGALVVAYVAVKPVWRQVQLMSTQTAVQMAPAVKERLQQLNVDYTLVQRLEEIDLAYTSLGVEFAEEEPSATKVRGLVNDIQHRLSDIPDKKWSDFCDRPDLPKAVRELRQGIRTDFGNIRADIDNLVRVAKFDHLSFLERTHEHCRNMCSEIEISVIVLKIEVDDYKSRLQEHYDQLMETAFKM